jgi:hypothetical protein
MFLKLLLLSAPLFLLTAHVKQTQSGSGSSPTAPVASPIKMGLWEATMIMGVAGTYKSRACLSQESYQRMLTRVPSNCTIKNLATTATSITGDLSCESPSGATSKGRLDVQIPDGSTVHGTVTATSNYQGHAMSMVIKSDWHFVSADCGDLSPGESRDIE